jgi:phage gp36-like protein
MSYIDIQFSKEDLFAAEARYRRTLLREIIHLILQAGLQAKAEQADADAKRAVDAYLSGTP